MLDNLEDFFINKFLGKLLVQVGVAVAAFAASGKLGSALNLSPAEVTGLLIALLHSALAAYAHATGKNLPLEVQNLDTALEKDKPSV